MALEKLEKKYFGTNGARGVTGKDMNPVFALGIAEAYATLLGPGKTIGLGMDTRTSGPALAAAVKAGITGCGCNIIDFGILPTPALQYVILAKKLDGGIMITASHNPPEYNGIKIIEADGTEMGDERTIAIEQLFINNQQKTADWDKLGWAKDDLEAYQLYIDAIVSGFPKDIGAGITIAIDPGSGAACKTAPEIFRRLGCTVKVINPEFDGTFPGRLPEPSEEGLRNLSELVVSSGAAFGIAHDGDADRAVFVDEKGKFMDGNITLALLASYYAEQHPGGEIVTPVSSSGIIEAAGQEYGCTTLYTVVGSPYVARTMREELDAGKNVIIGGEGNGGVIYPKHQFCRDGGMSGAVLLALLSTRKVALSSLIAKLPKFTMYQEKRTTAKAKEITAHMKEYFKDLPMDTRDGIRITKGGAWALIRPSGTEPLIRIYAESRDEKEAKALLDTILKEISPFLS
ncbi:MAG TPA: phosphoglucosamine mutase [Methanocorpusculum sp.]|nr:phosphoglucosamine mutase [Methanocorpusculum sp.]